MNIPDVYKPGLTYYELAVAKNDIIVSPGKKEYKKIWKGSWVKRFKYVVVHKK